MLTFAYYGPETMLPLTLFAAAVWVVVLLLGRCALVLFTKLMLFLVSNPLRSEVGRDSGALRRDKRRINPSASIR